MLFLEAIIKYRSTWIMVPTAMNTRASATTLAHAKLTDSKEHYIKKD